MPQPQNTNLISRVNQTNISTYNLLAQEYEERTQTLRKVTEQAVAIFDGYLKHGKEVLEPGCGVGLALNVMNEKGLTVTGIDISPEMAAFAQKRNPQSTVIVGDFLEYEFDRKFDGIFAFAFIHLFPKDTAMKILRKMHLLLNEGGIIYLRALKSEHSSEGWEVTSDYKKKAKKYSKQWTEEELKKALIETRFRIVYTQHATDPYGKVWMDFVLQG